MCIGHFYHVLVRILYTYNKLRSSTESQAHSVAKVHTGSGTTPVGQAEKMRVGKKKMLRNGEE